MPPVVTHAMVSCMHHAAHAHRQAGCPYDNMAHCKLIVYLPFMQAKGLLQKLTASHFNAINYKITNKTAGKDSHCNVRQEQA